jgi:3-hydroxyacyl-[acyl-carrier-protein] dehydratase
MRFLFCDRIVEINKGESIEGVKGFSLSEEFLNGHFEETPLVPGAIFIETMAQFLGWLIMYSHDFQYFPIISLIEDVEVTSGMAPGFEARVQARIVSTNATDSLGKAEIRVDGQPIARAVRMIYSHFSVSDPMKLRNQFNLMARSEKTTGLTWKIHG